MAYNIGKELNITEITRDASLGLSEVYEAVKMPDSALFYHKAFYKFADSIGSDKKKTEITRMGIQYDFDKKELYSNFFDQALENRIIEGWKGIFIENQVLPSGFIPSEDQGTIYGIIQTPPGATLERTNQVAQKLQKICEKVEGVESVSSLAGYEIMTEGRGSNAGTCLINLKSWSDRKHSVTEIMEELEQKSKDLGAVVEFFEPPAIPGFGSSGGFSMRLLDKTTSTNYQEFDKINKQFMAELGKRKELSGLFTFFAANYPQYELEINNDLAMQKGVSIGKAMENLKEGSIVTGIVKNITEYGAFVDLARHRQAQTRRAFFGQQMHGQHRRRGPRRTGENSIEIRTRAHTHVPRIADTGGHGSCAAERVGSAETRLTDPEGFRPRGPCGPSRDDARGSCGRRPSPCGHGNRGRAYA